MAHDASKVLLGTTRSSFKVIDNMVGTVEAGLVTRITTTGTLTLAKASGEILGVSVGKDLSDAGRTNICRSGLLVPLQVTNAFSPVLGTRVTVSDTTGMAAAVGAGATAVNAIYKVVGLKGIKEDGVTEVDVALVDFQGGL